MEKTESVDSTNPAGDVTLGEDITRLKNEVAEAQKRHEAHHLESMQPGGQRWAQVAYHQYWLSLCVTLQARKRLMLSPIGVDMGAMLWPVLSIILRQYGIQLGYEETLPVWALLSLSATCFLLDIATLLACSQDSQIVLVLVTVAHVPLYISMFAANLNKNLWVLTRLLVFLCALRVLAVLREITWLETRYHEGMQVNDGWLTRLIVWTLSSNAQRSREQLMGATEHMAAQNDDNYDADQDVVRVYIGSYSMEPNDNAGSTIPFLSTQHAPDQSATHEPCLESLPVPTELREAGGCNQPVTDRCYAHSSGEERDHHYNGAKSKRTPVTEGCSADTDRCGEDSWSQGGWNSRFRVSETCSHDTDVSAKSQDAADAMGSCEAKELAAGTSGGDGGGVVDSAAAGGFLPQLALDDSNCSIGMCTAASSLQAGDDGFGDAWQGSVTTTELYEVGR